MTRERAEEIMSFFHARVAAHTAALSVRPRVDLDRVPVAAARLGAQDVERKYDVEMVEVIAAAMAA